MKHLSVGFLVVLLLMPQVAPAQVTPAPQASAQATPDESGAVRATLANGMHVILLPNRLAPVATTIVSYGVGSDDDTLPGIAHATEHMLFRGTTNLSGGQLADIAARMGAEYNAATAFEYTLYYYKLPSPYVNVALRIEADRMSNATIRATDWATERGAIEQEIRARDSQPLAAVGQKLRQAFFAGTPFATASGGTIPSFEKMTAEDIRAFYRAWYRPSNATLIVAGDIDANRTLEYVHRQFDGIPDAAVPTRKPIAVQPLASSTVESAIDFPIGFGVLAFRLPGSNEPDYAASQVLSAVFANERSALGDLTAEGKTLAVLSLDNAFPEVGASFLLAIPANGATPQSAQALVMAVLDGYRTNGVPPDLIDAAKTRLLSERAYRQSSISGLGFEWADASAAHHTTPDAVHDAFAAVTADDVNRVLRTYFTPEHRLSIVITAKPSSTMPKRNPSAGIEHVGFTPNVHEPLPAWAQIALKAPLRAPWSDAATRTHRLSNGLRFVARRETAAPTVVVRGVVRTSPELYEPKGKDGVHLIVDDLLPWGTTTYDRKGFQTQLDAIAATAKLGTAFSLRVQSKDFERGMELLADGLLHPALAPAAFALVRTNEKQTVAFANKLPKAKADLAERLALYAPGDPRRRDITERTIGAVTLNDAKRYYRFAYRPDETALAIVGAVTPERAASAVSKYFGAWHATGAAPTFRYPRLARKSTKSETVTVKVATNVQSEVTLKQVFAMRRSDADYVPLLLANTILSGEGTGSLLFEELRTRRGYVYSTDSNFSVNRNEAEFSVSFASDPKNVRRANAAIVAIIKRLQSHALPAVELQRAKALLLAERVLPLDSYDGVADDILRGAKEGYAAGSEAWFWFALLQTTPAQLQHALRRIDADHFLRVIVEPDH
ncbi:MAG: insulinase family protein [Candidatus Eremiobacteraeota bacterium]|nr:insulinase family protein [Candidatus Eremiobacteraeota bacterium]